MRLFRRRLFEAALTPVLPKAIANCIPPAKYKQQQIEDFNQVSGAI